MLSIKNILTNKDSIPVLIFDEVDAGIGGGVAEVVGEKLKRFQKEDRSSVLHTSPRLQAAQTRIFRLQKNLWRQDCNSSQGTFR